MDLNEFMKDPWKPFNEMRKTPHEHDYDYRVDSSGTMFFEICKLCLDTSGVIELPSNECIKCGMSYKDPLIWESHQTMSDGNIWCAKRA